MTAAFSNLMALTAQITSAHCANNMVDAEALPGLIHHIYQALASVEEPGMAVEKPVPVVHPEKSVFADYIVCLEDGKKLKMLKRHLRTAYGMTPADYRTKWDLPSDYPMVAPNYAEKRSALAKQIGLGSKGEKTADHETAAGVPKVQYLPEHKHGRKKL